MARATGFPARLREQPGSSATEDSEGQTRRKQVRDLKHWVTLGAVLTAPVLHAGMVTHLVGEQYVPDLLESHYLQLLLILPVMLYAMRANTRSPLVRTVPAQHVHCEPQFTATGQHTHQPTA